MTQDQLLNLKQLVQLGLQKLAEDAQATIHEASALIPQPEPPAKAKPK